MISFFKKAFSNIYKTVSSSLSALFQTNQVDQETLKELKNLLIRADAGSKTTHTIIENLRNKVNNQTITNGSELRNALSLQLSALLDIPLLHRDASIILLVGVNGCGKTTLASKLAYQAQKKGKRVTLAAADTFRAAAPEQLEEWAKRTGSTIIKGKPGQDPASVVYSAAKEFQDGTCDTLIIDTAGRLQTKTHLMAELGKIKRVLQKVVGDQSTHTILTLDSMLGQNSMHQAKEFHQAITLGSVALTKMDGTGKGGIVFAIATELGLPISYVSHGENLDDLSTFDRHHYVKELLS